MQFLLHVRPVVYFVFGVECLLVLLILPVLLRDQVVCLRETFRRLWNNEDDTP